jgi:hypothetical protein
MRERLLLVGVACVAAALAGCSKTGEGHAANSRVCTPFPEQAANANGQPAPAPADPSAAADDCLHRWGYILAASPDRAEEAAQATLAACAGALTRWNQQGLAAGAPDATMTAPSLVTGQASNPIAEHFNYAQGRALFYVVQARAGKCAAPAAPVASAPR